MSASAEKTINLDTTRLAPAPHVLIKLIDLCHKPDVSIDELEAIISKDAALCAKVIGISNSAAYSQWNDVRDLKRIMVVLGTKTIKSIALTTAVHQFFSQFSTTLGETLGSFWLDALICANLTRKLGRLTGYSYLDEAHLAGLLHQLGQMVLLSNDTDEYQAMMASVSDQSALMFKEQQRYAQQSTDIAAEIIEKWNVVSYLADAIRFQNKPAELLQDTHQLVKLLSLSSQLSNRLNHSNNSYLVEDRYFGLNQAVIDELLKEAVSLAVKDAPGFGIEVDNEQAIPHANIDDETIRIELARKVRQIALLEGVQQHTASLDDFSEMIQLMRENLHLLFGLSAAIFFFPNAESSQLTGIPSHPKNLPGSGSFTIKLKTDRSLVTEAALQQKPFITRYQDKFEELPIVDVQILASLASPTFISLPLINRGHLIGVIAIGCNNEQAEFFNNDVELLQHFATIIADSFARQQQQADEHQQQLEQKQLEIDMRIRKVIHEVNNPLTIINNYLEILSMDMEKGSENKQHLETIKSEVERVGEMLLQLRDEQVQPGETHPLVDVNKLIQRLIDIFKPTFYKQNQIKSILQFDEDMPEIKTDQNRLKQIITNLVKNAVEALSNEGIITIKTRALVIVNKAQYVEITVADNGPGIPDHVLDNLFSPVQTSKGGHHSGLGLTIVNKLVTELGGSISYRTSETGGAEFIVLIPREQAD